MTIYMNYALLILSKENEWKEKICSNIEWGSEIIWS